ncbi:MAG: hypothetical protein GY826_11660 [Fuerstiella sp.]|nr:hypothetical protein [Fuerstiella sp.]
MKKTLKTLTIPDDINRLGDCPMRCGDQTILEFYVARVAAGVSPRMAEALAMQQAPGIGITDTTFIADQNRHGTSILDRMKGNKRAVSQLRRDLASHGYKLAADDHYIPTVARFPGDPEAIVNNKQGLADLEKRLESRGTSTQGMIEVKHDNSRKPPGRKYRLNPNIVERRVNEKIKADPGLALKPKQELVAQVIEQHGGARNKE